MTSIRPDPEEIKRSIAVFLKPGYTVELRVLNAGRDGTLSGYFNDPAKLLSAALKVDGRGPGVYVTMNRLPAELLARANNRVKDRVRGTTGDIDVVSRDWLLFDFDAKRPTGISATNAEHDLAISTAQSARETLSSLGWPAPIFADSGNGGHLVYAIDLPSDTESVELIQSVLNAADARFTIPGVIEVDKSVFNASRITKLYGTTVRKGDPTEDRPHRTCRILDIPDEINTVPRHILEALASEYKKPVKPKPSGNSPSLPRLDVSKWISDHGVTIHRGPVPDNGSEKWVLEACPFDPSHTAPDAAIFQQANGALAFKCLHNSCSDRKWSDFRAFYEPNRPTYSQPHATRYANGYTNGSPQVVNGHAAAQPEPEEESQSEDSATDNASLLANSVAVIVAAKDLSDVTGAYSPDFFSLCVQAGHIAAFNARQALKKAFGKDLVLKGVPGAWDNRYQAAVEKSIKFTRNDTDYIRSDNGGLTANVANAITMMRELPLGWDELSFRSALTAPSPWGTSGIWTDHDDVKAAEWCQRRGLNVKPTVAAEASSVLARENPFHPVRQYLQALEWDGEPRLDVWLVDYMGCPDSEYIRQVGPKWMISAVARVMEPGCQADYTLVFEGGQGRHKSTALRVLGGEWFNDDLADIGTKDSAIQLQGKWIVEISELDAFKKADMTTIKAWLVRREDHFRPPYGRRAEDFPRQNVFAASTNKDDWGHDDTGLRRFWPIRAGKIKLAELRKMRDQLWAETFFRYSAGEIYYLAEDQESLARAEQDLRQNVDAWRDGIEDWLEDPTVRHIRDVVDLPMRSDPPHRVYNADLMWHCLGLHQKDWNHSHKMRVSRIMRLAGYGLQRTPRKEDGRRPEFWSKISADEGLA